MWCSRNRLAFSVFCSFMLFYCCRLHSVSDRPTGCCSCVHRKQQLTPGLSYEHTHLHCILGAMLQHIFHCPLSYRHCLNLCLPVSILRLKFYASGFSLYGAHCVLLFSLIANFLLFFYHTYSRVTESLRLEKTFKSSHQPDLPNPIIKLCPLLPHPCLLNTTGDGDSTTSLSSLLSSPQCSVISQTQSQRHNMSKQLLMWQGREVHGQETNWWECACQIHSYTSNLLSKHVKQWGRICIYANDAGLGNLGA